MCRNTFRRLAVLVALPARGQRHAPRAAGALARARPPRAEPARSAQDAARRVTLPRAQAAVSAVLRGPEGSLRDRPDDGGRLRGPPRAVPPGARPSRHLAWRW